MRPLKKSLATLALLACAAPLTCLAASSAASSVSDSLTQSSGSVSDSLKDSSHSSSPDNKQAQGEFKVIDVAEVAEIGCGHVLTGLTRRIDPDLSARSVGTPAEIDAFIKEL